MIRFGNLYLNPNDLRAFTTAVLFESEATVRQTPPVARSRATSTDTVCEGLPQAFEWCFTAISDSQSMLTV